VDCARQVREGLHSGAGCSEIPRYRGCGKAGTRHCYHARRDSHQCDSPPPSIPLQLHTVHLTSSFWITRVVNKRQGNGRLFALARPNGRHTFRRRYRTEDSAESAKDEAGLQALYGFVQEIQVLSVPSYHCSSAMHIQYRLTLLTVRRHLVGVRPAGKYSLRHVGFGLSLIE